jgi:hypothetical protein
MAGTTPELMQIPNPGWSRAANLEREAESSLETPECATSLDVTGSRGRSCPEREIAYLRGNPITDETIEKLARGTEAGPREAPLLVLMEGSGCAVSMGRAERRQAAVEWRRRATT